MTENPNPSQTEPTLLKNVQELLGATKEGFEGVGQELRRLQDKNYNQESTLRDLLTSLALHEKDLKRVLYIIDGNGEKALNIRLANLENQLDHAMKRLDRVNDRIKDLEKEYKQDKNIWMQRMWDILKPLIAAAIAAGAVASGAGLL